MIRCYKNAFITQFAEINYLKCLKTINYLDVLRNNYNHRFDPSYELFDGTVNLFKESLDHYFLKKMTNDPEFIHTTECHNYFSYLKKLMNQNPFDFNTNIVLFNVIYNSDFSRYRFKFGFNNSVIITKSSQSITTINNILCKIRSNYQLTQEELDLICGFVHDYRENTPVIKEVITYIFNNLTNQDSKLHCSPQVAAAILTYVPYTCNGIRQFGFQPEHVRLFAATSYNHGKEYSGIGLSSESLPQIIINGKIAQDINFKSITALKSNFSFKDYFKKKDYSFPLIILTAFHEMTHQYQTYISKSPLDYSSEISHFMKYGYQNVVMQILDNELHDYRDNHDHDYIEIQATKMGWQMSYDFYQNVLYDSPLKDTLLKSCLRNKRTTEMRHSFAIKKNRVGKYYNSLTYDSANILKIMKDDQKREKYFKKYPTLKKIFSDQGKYRSDVIFISDFSSTNTGAYIIMRLVNSKKVTDIIQQRLATNNDTQQLIKNATFNIYQAIIFNEQRLTMIEYYSRHKFADSHRLDQALRAVADSIIVEYNKTLVNGRQLLNQVLGCTQYDSALDYSSTRAISRYQEIIENLNNKNNLKEHKK